MLTDRDMKNLGYSAAFRHAYDLLREYGDRMDDAAWIELDAKTAAFNKKFPEIELFVKSTHCAVLNEIARLQGK